MSGDDHERFRGLYAMHFAAVLAYCSRRIGRDVAPDVAADVFTVAWRKRDTMPDPEFVLPWLYAIASRTLANHRRTIRRRTGLVERLRGFASTPPPGPEVQVVRREEDEAVMKAIGRLRLADREILLLSAWEGMSASQIANYSGISLAAAEKRLTRAKQRLDAELRRIERSVRTVAPTIENGGLG
jgi:RNA polymerase sigma factor (sigma-70 family)